METSIFLIFTLLFGGGASNDLLDLIPTEVYWKAKDVEPTLANIMLDLNSLKTDDATKPTAVRRLMAIRTLGELKNPEAMSTLKAQLESKELFVSEYAQRAINTVEGKPTARASRASPERMKTDLHMLPAGCGAAGQVRFFAGKAMTLPKAKEGDENAAGGDPRSQIEQLSNSLIYVAEMTGNIRVEGVTMGVSDVIGPNQGFVVLYVRGEWDSEAVKAALQPEMNQTKTGGEIEFMVPQFGGAAIAVPSNELFALVSGPPANALPLDDIGESIKANKGKFDESLELTKVIESVDTTQPIWAAMIVSDNFRQAPQLAPFDNFTIVGKSTDEGLKYEAKATGKDPDAVKDAVEQLNTLVNEGRNEMSTESGKTPSAQPMADFMNSIELKADGANATGTAVMKKPG